MGRVEVAFYGTLLFHNLGGATQDGLIAEWLKEDLGGCHRDALDEDSLTPGLRLNHN